MASGTWTSVATSGVWSTASNWSGSVIADGSGSTANFASNITATTTLDTTIGGGWSGTIGSIVFSDNAINGSPWTLGPQSTITLAGGTPTITTTTSATISGILAGTAGLVKAGTAALTLAGANTFSGSITVNAGTLSATNAASLGADTARALIVGSGGALSLGVATTRSSFATSIAGTGVSNSGAIAVANTGTNNLGAITLTAAALIRATSAGTLANTITNNGFALTLAGSATLTVSGAISGTSALKIGISGSIFAVILSGANTYTGDTSLDFAGVGVSGSLGTAGTYAGNIAIAAGTSFGYNSATATTLSGLISGSGSFVKSSGFATATTITNTNTFSGVTTIQNGIVSVPVIANSTVNQPLGTNATLNFGAGVATGTLRYTGAGGTTNKVVNLTGTTTGGATIENNGTGALVFTSAITGVSASGTRTLTLQGSNASTNDFQGIIADVGGTGVTAVAKAGVGYWRLSGVNTFTGNVTVSGGQLEIPALTALGSGTKTISVSTSSARNASTILSGAGVTYPSTLSWSLSGSGASQTNEPMGAIRALAASTISGTVTLTGTSTVYADVGDLTLNGLVVGSGLTFNSRAVTGRTVTINGGIATGVVFQSVGPGITVWVGSASNATTLAPIVNGGTLRMVTTTSTGQFAVTSVLFGQTATQTTSISSRYQYTGGTLELSNSGAAGAVSYTGITNTGATYLNRGSGTLRFLRDSAQTFSVTLGTSIQSTNGVLTLEYGGTNPGTIGTDYSIIFSALTASNPGLLRTIINDGAAMVPVYLNASKVAIPMVYDGTQNNVAASQAGGTTLTTLSTNFGYYNLTADITAQVAARINNVRLAAGTMTLAAGAILQTQEVMDVGIGAARTIITGASGAKLARNIGGGATLSVYTNNVTGTGATISADMDACFGANFTKAGSGILTLSGAVANLSSINIAEGTFRIGSGGTFDSTFGTVTLGNIYAASGTTVAAEFNQSGDVVVAGLSGGGANTAVTLNGGDLVVRTAGSTIFGGDISLSASQKLKVKSLAPSPESNQQAFQGVFPFTAIEMSRGFISLDPQYGATVTGTPSITATGSARIDIQAQNPLEADYTVALGVLTASAGNLRVTLANPTTSGNPYNTRVTASSLTVTGNSVATLLNQTTNPQMSFTVSSVSTAGPMGSGVNVYNGSANIAYYRLAGETLAGSSQNFGGGIALVNTVDVPVYGTGVAGDANFPASKALGVSFASSSTENINVTGAQSAQTSQTMRSLRISATTITMATGSDRLTTDLIVLTNGTQQLLSGEIAPQAGLGNLYVVTNNTSAISSKITNNGATPTKLILYTNGGLTLSGANDYSGGTFIQGGASAITLSGTSPLGTGAVTGNGGAGFTLSASTNFTLGNALTLNDGGLVCHTPTAGFGYTISGVVSGTGDLYLTGSGNHVISGASNTANGALRMFSPGIVTLNAAQAFSEYDFNNSFMTFRYGTGVTQDISAAINKRSGSTYRIDTNGNNVTWASGVGNGSTYVKVGNGTHTLAAENFFASATVSTGTVQAGDVAALGYGSVTLSAGTTLQSLTASSQNGKLTITGTLSNSAGGTIRIGG